MPARRAFSATCAALILTGGASAASAAPVATGFDAAPGCAFTLVSWQNPGAAYDFAEIAVAVATDGTATGPWLSFSSVPTSPGIARMPLDLRGLVGDGSHAIRLTVREGGQTAVFDAPTRAVVDTSPPLVTAAFGAVTASRWLALDIHADDPQTGLDASGGARAEFARYDRISRLRSGPWEPLGDVVTGAQGVGVDVGEVPPGEYLGRVRLLNGCGRAGWSEASWWAMPDLGLRAPSKILVRLPGAGFLRRVGVQRVAQGRSWTIVGQVRDRAGRLLPGYRVTARMTDGTGHESATDARGQFELRVTPTHGGIVRIRASHRMEDGHLAVARRDIAVRLLVVRR